MSVGRALLRGLTAWLSAASLACTVPTPEPSTPPPERSTPAASLEASGVSPGPHDGKSVADLLGPAELTSVRAESVAVPGPAEPPVDETPHEGPLAAFLDALRDLERGRRTDHVRIMWLGDSHAQADFWTGTLREELQRRFGSGGPGFVHLGYKAYRHGGVRLEVEGKWRLRPKPTSSSSRHLDGALGLGGILTAGYADTPQVDLFLTDAAVQARTLRWDLCLKLQDRASSFGLQLGDGPMKRVRPERPGRIEHLRFETKGATRLRLRTDDTRTELCGVVIETEPSEGPGVVVDNLGINGARYSTALAWDAAHWAAEVRRRPPELFVVEYGGNETGDFRFRPDAYQRSLRQLVRRLRLVQPAASCLVVGLTERNDFVDRIPLVRDRTRDAAVEEGCAFWDSYEQMGGRGSMKAWQDAGKAYADGIHLNIPGYRQIAGQMLVDLLGTYRGRR